MTDIPKPDMRPANPRFGSGPCSKRPGWSADALSDAFVGRSHRSAEGKQRIADVIALSREVLGVPEDYMLGIVPASDTGAVEMALWSLLGPRGVDVLAWESFGKTWVSDVLNQLRLEDVRVFDADYGDLPDLEQADFSRDVVFVWNGTTSGVRVPNGDWIADDREGLVICDATSAAFAMDLAWDKLDVVTYSWQKVLGGEAQHGVIVLSPRAWERVQTHKPAWPMPKLFRLNKGVFEGSTINTPSMIAVEDARGGLQWAKELGGLPALIGRAEANLAAIAAWVERTDWIDFLAREPETRSCTSVCLKIVDPAIAGRDKEGQTAFSKRIAALLAAEDVAYDIGAYKAAPPGLRLWTGATIETTDVEALLPWLDWAFAVAKAEAEG